MTTGSQRQGQLRQRGKGEAVMAGGAVDSEPFLVLLGPIADVGGPAVSGVPGGQAMHQSVSDGLGENGGGGDGLTAGVPINQGLVGVADFWQRQPVDEDSEGLTAIEVAAATLAQGKAGEARAADQTGNGPPHRNGAGHPNVVVVNLVRGGVAHPKSHGLPADPFG